MRSSFVAAVVVVVPLVGSFFACGGSQTQPAAPGTEASTVVVPIPSPGGATEATSASGVPAPSQWTDSLTKPQRVAMMKQRVVPAMKPIFQAADAKRYEDFGCATCHGPDFKLPKEYLPKLHLQNDKLLEFTTKPEVAKLMAEKVVPAMASALGLPPYDPATKQGFGCGGCHTIDMVK